jgi:hypothetical protein
LLLRRCLGGTRTTHEEQNENGGECKLGLHKF